MEDIIIKMITVGDLERMERFKKRARLGGLARARKLSAKRRKEIAKEAAKKRWKNQLKKGRVKT